MRRRGCHLCEPHPRGCDGRERPRALVRVRQSAQGRGAQRRADRRMPDQPQADPGEEEGGLTLPLQGGGFAEKPCAPDAVVRPRDGFFEDDCMREARTGTAWRWPLRCRGRADRGPPAMTIRPRRSVLYMPGSNARAIEKARGLPPAPVILDLHDSSPPHLTPPPLPQLAHAL